jgi:hypothetical protein
VAGAPGEDLGDRHPFILGLVRQHRPGNHVADGVDAGDVGGEMRVRENAAFVVLLHAGVLQAEPLRVGHAPD